MEDRELLEMAAKAAGIRVEWCQPGMTIIVDDEGSRQGWWNPLEDDGDALRLAVKLRISVMLAETTTDKPACYFFDGVEWACVQSDIGNDPDAATRRAIVRAAAEIGKQMA